ncbi:MAG: STAS domain-containing protein [Spirochaetes bacterium]|nr:STAS domain-containing protein [Spirochaetota bacterium]
MMEISFKNNTVKVSGEVDIFCADQLKSDIINHGFTEDFCVDLEDVNYIDSSGIGALISLYNHFEKLNISFHVNPSLMVRKIFTASKLDSLFFKEKQTRESENILFQDSFVADTKILAYIIDRLFRDLEKADYPHEDSQEIVVSVDEAITNAILETIKATGEVIDDLDMTYHANTVKTIAVKWEIKPEEFFATIIDHGSGFDMNKIKTTIPDTTGNDYLAQVGEYQQKCNLQVRLNGENITLNRLGAGLKIMTAFMDAIIIDLIDVKESDTGKLDKEANGTILNLYRKRKH